MKDKLLKMIASKEARKKELGAKAKKSENADEVRSILEQVDQINDEIDELRSAIDELESKPAGNEGAEGRRAEGTEGVGVEGAEGRGAAATPQGGFHPMGTYGMAGTQQRTAEKTPAELREEAEKRGKDLKEKRTITISSSNIVVPNYAAKDIKPTFNEVSTLIDRVNIKNFIGGESFKQPYSTGYGEGGYTEEGGDPTTAEATWDYAEVKKTKITAYAEDPEEVLKLPAADYDEDVQKGIRIALRKKGTKEILIGDGAEGHFVGIFDDGATAIDSATDKSISEIDETTLDEIIYSFGGDEDVEDVSVLVLNKLDLKAFAMLRDADGKKIYEIKAKGNTGTIDEVPYLINSNCKAISSPTTTTGQYAMAYGPLSNYTMAIFSDTEITRSTDYKFKEGMIAHRGVFFAGGNVTAKNGFLRVKKA